jgi:hypothetical protein
VSAVPLPEDDMHEEDEGLVSPHQPFDSTPTKGIGHPFASVWRGVMDHVFGRENGKLIDGDSRCCRPFREDPIEVEKPPTKVEFLRGARRTNRGKGRRIAG